MMRMEYRDRYNKLWLTQHFIITLKANNKIVPKNYISYQPNDNSNIFVFDCH